MVAAAEDAVENRADEAAEVQANGNAGNRQAAAAAYGPFQALIRRINPSLILKLLVLCFLLIQVKALCFFFLFFFSILAYTATIAKASFRLQTRALCSVR